VQLALVGMHVVGSTLGHPEMVWAMFEHVGDAPLASYSYSSAAGQQTVSQNKSGTWLFSQNGSQGPFNQAHMSFTGLTGAPANGIAADVPFTISPSDTLRTEPWGMDGPSASSNTEVNSMNGHVLGMLAPGDLRANYVMTGATWTAWLESGGTDAGRRDESAGQLDDGDVSAGTNCLSCHQNMTSSSTAVTTEVSHVFPDLQPLF